MITSLWNWFKGLYSDSAVREVEQERLDNEVASNLTREIDNMQKEPSVQEVAAALKGTTTHQEVEKELSYVVKVPAGTMNRKMRRFLKVMGRTQPNGKILAPRKTTKQLWQAFNSIMKVQLNKNLKRQAFVRSFGK